MSVLIKIGNKEMVDGLYNVESIHYDPERLNRESKEKYHIILPYLPQREKEVGDRFFADVNKKELFLYKKDGEEYTFVISVKALILLDKVEELRDKYIYTNHSYTFPDGSEDYIQLRNEIDRQNFQDIMLDALDKESDEIIKFRPLSNNIKEMKASEVIEMNKFLKQKIDGILENSWNLKNEIRNSSDLDSIDINKGWE